MHYNELTAWATYPLHSKLLLLLAERARVVCKATVLGAGGGRIQKLRSQVSTAAPVFMSSCGPAFCGSGRVYFQHRSPWAAPRPALPSYVSSCRRAFTGVPQHIVIRRPLISEKHPSHYVRLRSIRKASFTAKHKPRLTIRKQCGYPRHVRTAVALGNTSDIVACLARSYYGRTA
jgi:hypothetical protein